MKCQQPNNVTLPETDAARHYMSCDDRLAAISNDRPSCTLSKLCYSIQAAVRCHNVDINYIRLLSQFIMMSIGLDGISWDVAGKVVTHFTVMLFHAEGV